MEDLQKWIKSYPDFPSKGILFRDISPLLAEPSALSLLKDKFLKAYIIFIKTYLSLIKKNQREIFINRFLNMMPIMLLARIDGKSPVEYIKKQKIKKEIRLLSFTLLKKKLKTIEQVINTLNE